MNLSGAPLWVSAGLGLIAVIALAAIVFWVVRRMSRGLNFSDSAQRGKRSRLGVIDAYDIDRQRRLILLRRDNVEHLVMIGGPNDVLIEPTIRRGVAQASRGQATGAQPTAAPLPANMTPREVPQPPRIPEPAATRVKPTPVPEPVPGPQPANVAQRMAAPAAAPQAPQAVPPRNEPQPAARPDLERARRPEPAPVAPAAVATAPAALPPARSRLPDADLAAMAHKLEEALRRPAGGAPTPVRGPIAPAPEPAAPKPTPAPAKPIQASPPAPMTAAMSMPTAMSMPSSASARPVRPPEPPPKPPAPGSGPRPPEPPGTGSSVAPKPAEAGKPQAAKPQAANPSPETTKPRPPTPAQPATPPAPKNDTPDLDSLEAEMAKLLGRPPLPGESGS
ncbi:MAG: flagellar biosynthetic protein FliO [Hyphomicrobiales bacterium]|nr:flagellar biosynthetic protein FliO [Hyphomicrobiales bacterium]